MKSVLPLLSVLLFAASCTTAYKSGQTPDDVYYSPNRPVQEYAQNDKEDEDRYISPEEREERYVRMKSRDRRWADLEEDYTYRPVYTYTVNPWNDYNHWNYYYNPYCCCNTPTKVPVKTAYNKPRTFNLGVYTPPVRTTANIPPVKGSVNNTSSRENSNYRGSNQSAGSWLRSTITGSSNNSSNSNSGNTNSSRGSSNSSSSGSSSGSGATKASVRKF